MTTDPDDDGTEERQEFCSPEWVACVRSLIRAYLAEIDLSGITMSFSEELTDPPTHLVAPDRSPVGWHYRIVDGALSVDARPMPDADLRMIGDYNTVVALAGLLSADPDFGPLVEAAINAGSLRYEGSSKGGDRRILKAIAGLHDDLVPHTA